MKNGLLIFCFLFIVQFAEAQCTVNGQVINNATCFNSCNGSATVTVTGGGPNYTYSWTPAGGNGQTASNLCAGTYTCAVSDGFTCFSFTTVTITQPPALTNIVSTFGVSCFGGSDGCAAVIVSGGTPPYTYGWPGSCTGSTCCGFVAGNYSVSVTDANGCATNSVFIITQPSQLNITTSTINVRCNGECNGSAIAFPNGGTLPYSYMWSPGGQTGQTATGLCAGTYTVTVTDANGCTRGTITNMTQPNPLSVTITSLSSTSAYATVTGGTPGYTYMWIPVGQNSPTATGLPPGNYTCCVTDQNGCSTCSPFIMTSVDEYSEEDGIISVYPNPFHSSATILLNEKLIMQNGKLVIYDALGNEVRKIEIRNAKAEIANLSPGIYLLKIEGLKNKTVKRLVVY
jgi:hypothetical protein